MDREPGLNTATMGIFAHHLYELSKGLRPLILMTLTPEEAAPIVARLVATATPHHVHEACPSKVNVLFGRPAAVLAARRFLTTQLCNLSAEHDFMLGILLGYDCEQQCLRYLARTKADAAQPWVVPEADTLRPAA
ncbi:conserved protein of unknown function [Rhodovastum atsumiense]|uniref:DUF2023 family protein n=1 Tax=Rhodovastum atsumiense TaxID=504468 RepID=A0A5M6IYS7_9PROT|nr:DUF2023 family protein [Rhodovastum atsumiense]KAA5613441.1 DUF2023 family protein [Rhodovastum atsumiense]CAH2603174.1 conserved protein of unknown function [Rhodovastum atsumiense]